MEELENQLSKKAEKDLLIHDQQKFFDNLTHMENETDATITKLVGDELKKLGDQISQNTKILEKKIEKVYKDIDIEKMNKQVEKKLNKDEARDKFEN